MSVYAPGVNSKSKRATDIFNSMSCKTHTHTQKTQGDQVKCGIASFTPNALREGRVSLSCFRVCSLPHMSMLTRSAGVVVTFQFSFSQLHEKNTKITQYLCKMSIDCFIKQSYMQRILSPLRFPSGLDHIYSVHAGSLN